MLFLNSTHEAQRKEDAVRRVFWRRGKTEPVSHERGDEMKIKCHRSEPFLCDKILIVYKF